MCIEIVQGNSEKSEHRQIFGRVDKYPDNELKAQHDRSRARANHVTRCRRREVRRTPTLAMCILSHCATRPLGEIRTPADLVGA